MANADGRTELLPDEYQIKLPFSVHIFAGKGDEAQCTSFISGLKSCRTPARMDVKRYPMDTYKNITEKLDELAKLDYEQKSCFILVMMGQCGKITELGTLYADNDQRPIKIETIWGRFVCVQSLRKKPKMFFIQATASKTVLGTDSMYLNDCPLSFPLEADLFITYKNLSARHGGEFIKKISEGISKHAKRDDIIAIISLLNNEYDLKTPRIISTLTKKFYFQSHPYRGCSGEIVDRLRDVATDIDDLRSCLKTDELKKSKSVESMSRATSLQSIPSRMPRTPIERRNSVVVSPIRPRANSKGKMPWKP